MKNISEIPLQQTKAWEKLQQDLHETTFFLSENTKTTSSPRKNSNTTSASSENSDTTSTQNQNQKTTIPPSVNYQMLIIKKSTPFGPYFYLPYGPYIRQKTAAKAAYTAILALAKHENAIFIRIEPKMPENAAYWLKRAKKSKDLSPKETWILDLTPPLETLYRDMKQNTRNLARNYSKKGLTVKKVAKTPENCQILYHFLQTVAKNNHFNHIEEKTLLAEINQPFSSLYIAYLDLSKIAPDSTPLKTASAENPSKTSKIPIAASLFFDTEKTRFYMQSGADPDYHKFPATLAILSEAIKDAKAKNLENFDFWGIAPENAKKNHPWAGFTKFKKSFGGTEVDYAGTHDIILKPAKYRLYHLFRQLNLLKRKIFH